MAKSLYLINPRSEPPSYFGAEVFEHCGFEPAQAIADLATVDRRRPGAGRLDR